MSNSETYKRQKMVEEQLMARGIKDELVLASFLKVPRHIFIPPSLYDFAYEDTPLPIGEEQTISQPFIIALMLQMAALTTEALVLEIGTGSGYSAALLSQIVGKVYTIERLPNLALMAQERFQQLNYQNINLKIGDGTFGWPEKGPFDAILINAGSPVIPSALSSQLKERGRLVIPIGERWLQSLSCFCKIGEKILIVDSYEWVRFVPLIGEQGGWKI